MSLRTSSAKKSAEQALKDIRRATRRHFLAEDKIRIVLDGLRGRVQPPIYAPVICGFTKHVSGTGGRMPRA